MDPPPENLAHCSYAWVNSVAKSASGAFETTPRRTTYPSVSRSRSNCPASTDDNTTIFLLDLLSSSHVQDGSVHRGNVLRHSFTGEASFDPLSPAPAHAVASLGIIEEGRDVGC